MQVAGSVTMLQGVAHLALAPTGASTEELHPLLQGVAHLALAPTGASTEELHPPPTESVLSRMRNGELEVHPSKKTMEAADLSTHYHNIQKDKQLRTGLKGGWTPAAQQELEDWLRRPKRPRASRTQTSEDVSSLQQKIDTLEAEKTELQTISTQAYSLQKKIDTLKAEKTELYDELGDTEKHAKEVEQEKEDLQNKVVQLQQEIQSLKDKVAELEKER